MGKTIKKYEKKKIKIDLLDFVREMSAKQKKKKEKRKKL